MAFHLNCQTRKKGNTLYKYYSICESYRNENGSPRKKIIKYLGALTESEILLWKEKIKVFKSDEVEEKISADEIKSFGSRNYLDVAVINKLIEDLGIPEAYKFHSPSKELSTIEVVKILILARSLQPQSHLKTTDWLNENYISEILGIKIEKFNKDKIFRELNLISSRRLHLQKIFLKNSLEINKDKCLVYFFDGTTSFFEGSECELSRPGHDKTNGFQDHMFSICILTDYNGLPIAWDTVEGTKRDVTEFKNIGAILAKEMGIEEITYCFDRGVSSQSNFEIIEKQFNSKFITGLDQNQIEKVFDVDTFYNKTKEHLLDKWKEEQLSSGDEIKKIKPINGFYRRGEDRFYCELGIPKNQKYRYVASFNVNIYEAQQLNRLNNIEFALNKIKEMNQNLKAAKGSRDYEPLVKQLDLMLKKLKLNEILLYEVVPISKSVEANSIQIFKINTSINNKMLDEQSKFDGLLIYITNHTEKIEGQFKLHASQIVDHYSSKAVIENTFRYLKSFLDLRPVYVRKVEHVRAHVDICMSAFFVNRTIELKLKSSNISINKFFKILKRNSSVVSIGKEKKITKNILNQLSDEVIDLLKKLNVESVISNEVLSRLNIQY